MKKKPADYPQITFRASAELIQMIEEAARLERRTRSNWILKTLIEAATSNTPNPNQQNIDSAAARLEVDHAKAVSGFIPKT